MQETLTDAVRAHEPIVQALREHDAAATQEALRTHIETSYAEFLGTAQAYTLTLSTETPAR
jgi:DNA-binding GntR family transcriptional regulator